MDSGSKNKVVFQLCKRDVHCEWLVPFVVQRVLDMFPGWIYTRENKLKFRTIEWVKHRNQERVTDSSVDVKILLLEWDFKAIKKTAVGKATYVNVPNIRWHASYSWHAARCADGAAGQLLISICMCVEGSQSAAVFCVGDFLTTWKQWMQLSWRIALWYLSGHKPQLTTLKSSSALRHLLPWRLQTLKFSLSNWNKLNF